MGRKHDEGTEPAEGTATDAAQTEPRSGIYLSKAGRTHVCAMPVADGSVLAVFPVSVVNAEKFYAEHDPVDA